MNESLGGPAGRAAQPAFARTQPAGLEPETSAASSSAPPPEVFLSDNTRSYWLLAVLFGIIALVTSLVVLAAFLSRDAGFGTWVALVVDLGLLWLVRFTVRAARDKRPVVQLSSEGITARNFKYTIPWHALDDVVLERVQQSATLRLKLMPAAREAAAREGRKKNPAINLYSLKPATQDAVFAAAGKHLLRARLLAGAGEAPSMVEAREAQAFEQRLKALTPITWALYAVVALNVGVWVANVAAGMSAFKPLAPDLLRWGANSAWAVTQGGEYWRLLTATVLHAGLVHLAFNMLGLWEAGRLLSRLYGNWQFLLVYWCSAMAGSAASLHFSAFQRVSVGASGAVFGVLGALVVALYANRKTLPASMSSKILTSQGIFVVYALVQGFAQQNVDNAAHVGGLLGGAVLAALLVTRTDAAGASRRWARALAGVALTALAVVGSVRTVPEGAINHRALFAAQSALQSLGPRDTAAWAAMRAHFAKAKAEKLEGEALVGPVERVHLPAFRAIGSEMQALESDGTGPLAPMLVDLKLQNRLLTEMLALEVQRVREPEKGPDIDRRMATLQPEMRAVSARLTEKGRNAKTPTKP